MEAAMESFLAAVGETEPDSAIEKATEPQATEPQATEPQVTEPPATEPQAAEPQKRRRRWGDIDVSASSSAVEAESSSPAAASSISPALVALAPSLGFLAAAKSTPAPAIDESVAQKAQEAMRRVSDLLKGSSTAAASGAAVATTGFELDIDINDSSRKGQLTKKQFQDDVAQSTGATILIRGRYKPPGDTSTDERPLHLHLQAKSQEDLDKAEAMIREVMGPPAEAPPIGAEQMPPPPNSEGRHVAGTFVPGLPPPPSQLSSLPPHDSGAGAASATSNAGHTCRLEVDVEPAMAYQVRGKLLGPKGSYLKHIQEQSGARVQLSGKGSNNHTAEGKEAEHALSLDLNAQSVEQLEVAKQLAQHLIKSVEDNHRQRTVAQPASTLPAPPSCLANGAAVAPGAGVGGAAVAKKQ